MITVKQGGKSDGRVGGINGSVREESSQVVAIITQEEGNDDRGE